jgi:Domain of unknown function (DUF4922)
MMIESSDLLELWWQKHATGFVRYDPSLLVLHEADEVCGEYGWGTLFYSKAREEYKARVGSLPEKAGATFDLELMKKLELLKAGDLIIAANPNSIVPGHLVIYPAEKRERLTLENVEEMGALARQQSQFTFIHNMEQAAASIIDWAHFQAYPWDFPISKEAGETIIESSGFTLACLTAGYPAYVLTVSGDAKPVAQWLFQMLERLLNTGIADDGVMTPCNIIWRGDRAWFVPRSPQQTTLAATYIGALELGGLFCLPSADSMRQYLPEKLRTEVRQAGIADQRELRERCEQTAREIASELKSS